MNPPRGAPAPPSVSQQLDVPNLPISQLESLRFKANQIIESIQALMYVVIGGGGLPPGQMPSWPDILSKYNIILSQTHNFSNSLVNPLPVGSNRTSTQQQQNAENIFQKIVLLPKAGITDQELDSVYAHLLNNAPVMDVLKQETDTVNRLSEHMSTRGVLGVLGIPSASGEKEKPAGPLNGMHPPKKPEYEDVIRECAEIRDAHDRLVDRAVRAVNLLRDKYDWKTRVVVDVEEPEESEWDGMVVDQVDVLDGLDEDDGPEDGSGSSDADEANVEEMVDRPSDMDVQTPVDLFGGEGIA